jgi:hypothetical protein
MFQWRRARSGAAMPGLGQPKLRRLAAVGEVLRRHRAFLLMISDEVFDRAPHNDVRDAGLFTESRLGKVGGDKMMIEPT